MNTDQILRELVSIPSYSGEEKEVADWIATFCTEHQLPVERQGDNVLIVFRSGKPTCLHFNGHMDTVGAGDVDKWHYPPNGPEAGTISEGRLYGLGASDMKGTLASYLSLACQLKTQDLPIDVIFSFVTEEETSGRGSAEFVAYFQEQLASDYSQSFCIAGEPTDLSFIEIGNRGTMFVQATVRGEARHASQRDDVQANALLMAMEAVQKIAEQEKEWKKDFRDPVLGEPQTTLTKFHSAPSSPNQIPDRVELLWDVRTTPGFHEEVLSLFSEALGGLATPELHCDPCHYSTTPKESLLVQKIQKVAPQIECRIARGANDCGEFTKFGIDAVTLGPGEKGVIHAPNESILISKLDQAVTLYRDVIFSFE